MAISKSAHRIISTSALRIISTSILFCNILSLPFVVAFDIEDMDRKLRFCNFQYISSSIRTEIYYSLLAIVCFLFGTQV